MNVGIGYQSQTMT